MNKINMFFLTLVVCVLSFNSTVSAQSFKGNVPSFRTIKHLTGLGMPNSVFTSTGEHTQLQKEVNGMPANCTSKEKLIMNIM